jgi:hypothetical protein
VVVAIRYSRVNNQAAALSLVASRLLQTQGKAEGQDPVRLKADFVQLPTFPEDAFSEEVEVAENLARYSNSRQQRLEFFPAVFCRSARLLG